MLKQTLLKAIEAGAAEMSRFFNGSFKISNKEGINNLVTEADHAAEKAIFNVIQQEHPDHYILSEESGEIFMDSSVKWIIDPIDGTVNFANGIPICCVSIGVEQNGQMILGAVYNPFLKEFFFAQHGFGATLNNKMIQVSNKTEVSSSCLATGFPYTYLDMPNGPLQVFEKLIRKGVPVRRLGSAAIDLCWVAAGRFDGFFEHKLQVWDSAAGFLIVEEAGGKVTDFAGNRYSPYQPHIIASNGKIHDELVAIVNGANF
ncbi:MAG: inositol monophosphatase [Chitinophagaceae bacterium]|nr:inositol monophosphatase [Chitinophagaceae bacterium]MDP1764666.1 inositol monophosphatase family protein [Sediminibacterium sp.]MDP1812301.1 inositol monophosphatase family protein [Sediminibacterium sp.]MDP3128859.1 inositol monophosphatase family protein [Sediminibacterium sp.]MDP3666158.1 inositol monophosphatase family protein [Sediminibacterium sp.]